MNNRFYYGNPVPVGLFLGRSRLLRRVAGRIANSGQSSTLVGEPRMGKTSFLNYLAAPQNQSRLFPDLPTQLVFSFLDSQMLPHSLDQAQFWALALKPLAQASKEQDALRPVRSALDTCRRNSYGAFVLERLFVQLAAAGGRFALLLDEFDTLLEHPMLNKAEFFGSLRGLASQSNGGLALVIASRAPLTAMNDATKEFNRMGSPYFNIFDEVTLGGFSHAETGALLARAGERFNADECKLLKALAGGHPYLLQVGCAALWESYEAGERSPAARRQEIAGALFTAVETTLKDPWQHWTLEMRKVFTIVALDEMPRLLGEVDFDLDQLRQSLIDYGPELRQLKNRGLVVEDTKLPGGWRVASQVMLWWLAEELLRALRARDEMGAWLRQQQWDGLFTVGEKEQLLQAVRSLGEMLKGGEEAFIKAVAEGAAKGISGV